MDFEIAPVGTQDLLQALAKLKTRPVCGGAAYLAFDGRYFPHYGACPLERAQQNAKSGLFQGGKDSLL
jgi:hypothetical protein